jgi:hypothetical protein
MPAHEWIGFVVAQAVYKGLFRKMILGNIQF